MATATRRRIPRRLMIEPLLEAVWELRFEGATAAGGALLGTLFEKIKAQGENVSIEALPLASVPSNVREAQEQFRYAPTTVLRYRNHAIFVGDRCAALSVVRPYPGWQEYEKNISTLAGWLRDSGMLKTVEHSTLKYLDFFDYRPEEVFKKLRTDIRLGGIKASPGEFQMQAKVEKSGLAGTIRIMNPTSVAVEGRVRQGLVTDIQMGWGNQGSQDFWAGFNNQLRKAKIACHELFFGLLTEETIKAHKPVYED